MSTSEVRSRRPRLAAAVVLVGFVLGTTGCIEKGIQEALEPFDYEAMALPPGDPREPGSIWPGVRPAGSFLFFDRKARGVGDLVTVRVVERMSASGQATTDLSKGASLGATINSDLGFQELLAGPIKWLFRVFGVSSPGNPVTPGVATNVLSTQYDDEFEGDGSTRRSGNFTATVACRVMSELPGGVFHVRGRRAIAVNHEMQYVSVEGLVRQQDIGIDNVVNSDVLAEARIALDGLGVVDDKQRPGWMTRVLSWAYPF